jgi:hypothetical protein
LPITSADLGDVSSFSAILPAGVSYSVALSAYNIHCTGAPSAAVLVESGAN